LHCGAEAASLSYPPEFRKYQDIGFGILSDILVPALSFLFSYGKLNYAGLLTTFADL
jgi:hypothetical protein